MKYTFSGHESFQCKSLWLKKGYDFVKSGQSFNDDYAVVTLGVGKNMVSSIKFWLRAFVIIDEMGALTKVGEYIFGKEGKDQFIEDVATKWLLHYLLVNSKFASLYNIFFTDFLQKRHEFNKEQSLVYMRRLFSNRIFGATAYNENTISRDISTLLKNYVRTHASKNFDDFSAVLTDLNLLKQAGGQYKLNHEGKARFEPLIFLFAILDKYPHEKVIEYQKILELASIFCLSQSELYEIFNSLNEYNSSIGFSNAAGEQLFSINAPLDKWQVLNDYYSKN